MEITYILLSITATLIILIVLFLVKDRVRNRERDSFYRGIVLLRAELMACQQALMNNLTGPEAEDLIELARHASRKKSDRFKPHSRFDQIWSATSEKTRQAFKKWDEEDQPLLEAEWRALVSE